MPPRERFHSTQVCTHVHTHAYSHVNTQLTSIRAPFSIKTDRAGTSVGGHTSSIATGRNTHNYKQCHDKQYSPRINYTTPVLYSPSTTASGHNTAPGLTIQPQYYTPPVLYSPSTIQPQDIALLPKDISVTQLQVNPYICSH